MKISHLGNIDPQRITNIVFDWGGVITEIDFDITIEKFKKLGYNGFTQIQGNYPHSEIMLKFEIGEVPPEAIIEYMQPKMSESTPPEKIWEAWNALLLDTPEEHIEILKTLAGKYRLLLLSNTNIVHTSYYRNFLNKKFGLDFFDLFTDVFLSYELKKRKPEPDIFMEVITRSKIIPEETLFIDDLESNVDTAVSLGMFGLHHQKNAPLKPVFEKWLG
jgi:glucose-1-phosphatase